MQYITDIIVPYVKGCREEIGDHSQSALVIMDNFKGQVTNSISALLEAHNIHVCLLPANTTDLLQPMDITVNKPAKDFLKQKFEQWYSDEVVKQLNAISDIESAELQPVNLCMAAVSAQWMVEMAEYIADNPQFIVNGFRKAGIPQAIDGLEEEEEFQVTEECISEEEFISDH